MKISASVLIGSRYLGMPLFVFREILGRDSCQPSPKGPLPEALEYCKPNEGAAPARLGLKTRGTARDAVPVTDDILSFSPMPWMPPPPLGTDTDGIEGNEGVGVVGSVLDVAGSPDLPTHGGGAKVAVEEDEVEGRTFPARFRCGHTAIRSHLEMLAQV
jgi:hypothetical protein